ncbi:MAG: bifunctional (p)ppGpp synthetase/guanosine-3',5'-bis(diphosphate) 3'-pyrophosphohydrolase [Acetobacteraceae bacterium]|nr:bifunctional (p)ppGpp synthetase/guanosine-3',5'-bis(diphosphate) 3'-pyrophosphohydrolase [Acetobacteraceae bacterium]
MNTSKETLLSASSTTIGLSFTETRKVFQALAFAAHKHRDQCRKDVGASPYMNHPIALADILVNEGGITDHVVLCAAILHDTIEDTETTHEELVRVFGREIADVVAEVTDNKALDKPVRKMLQIEHAANASPRAKLVKLADKTCNLRDLSATPPADWPEERRREYFEWAKRVIEGMRGTNAQLEAAFDRAFAVES